MQEMRETVVDFSLTVPTMLGHVEKCAKWIIAELSRLNTWMGGSVKVVLVGDAAHPM